MTNPIREAAEAKAITIVNAPMCNPCTCRTDTTIECGQLRDAITNALIAARAEGMRAEREACAELIENWHVLRDGDMTRAKLAEAIRAHTDEIEKEPSP